MKNYNIRANWVKHIHRKNTYYSYENLLDANGNQFEENFNQIKRFFNGVGILNVLTGGLIPIGKLWITGVANCAHIENKGNGVVFGFKLYKIKIY